MESPVVVDKPPEYHGNNDRGFPFEEEEGSGAWSELAARHPDIAARLRQRPATATWARKRRPSSQDATDDFGESFSGFDRFPFDDIPPEFREHFPSHWNRRFDRDEPSEPTPTQAAQAHAHTQPQPHAHTQPQPQHHTAATQTENDPEHKEQTQSLPQYGLRNTVDLGQRSPVDADERTQRSVSAPPDAPHPPHSPPDMSAHNEPHHEPPHHHQQQPSTVRHIPIFVEGRDEPVINKNVDHGTHFGDTKPAYQPQHHSPPHVDREQYFADDGPAAFHHPPNFTRAFGTPFNKGFRQGPQPFTQQKAYPQSAFARAPSPQRSHSPKPPPQQQQEEPFVKVPVHHEQAPPRQQHKPPPPKQPSPQREQTPPPRPQPSSNDPITQILSIQTDVLNLMTEVENFKGTKKDKRYIFLDEMLTRNLIKLDNIETEGKENIRLARKEAIRCIQKCIAVLEAKAESNDVSANAAKASQALDVEMKENSEPEHVTANGDVAPQLDDSQQERLGEAQPPKESVIEEEKREATPKPQEQTQEQKMEPVPSDSAQAQTSETDTRTEETKPEQTTDEQKQEEENKPSPKKKVVKKRDKSKDNKEAAKDSNTVEASKDSNKPVEAETGGKVEVMQVDDKGDKTMEVDGAASQ